MTSPSSRPTFAVLGQPNAEVDISKQFEKVECPTQYIRNITHVKFALRGNFTLLLYIAPNNEDVGIFAGRVADEASSQNFYIICDTLLKLGDILLYYLLPTCNQQQIQLPT